MGFIRSIIASFNEGRARYRARKGQAAPLTAEQIVRRLHLLNEKFLAQTFTPAAHRARCLSFKLGEISKIAQEAEADILADYKSGGDVHGRIADLRTAFKDYEKCFAELSVETHTLQQSSRIYAEELDLLIGGHHERASR